LFFNGNGGFANDGAEYHIRVSKDPRQPDKSLLPPAPWSNVVANVNFGFVATESTLGCSWSGNSFHNRLTPWSNDPVLDPPGEVIYLRDEQTGEFWSTTPSPAGRDIPFTVRFGQGYVAYDHEHTQLRVELRAFVDRADPVKILSLRVTNLSDTPRRLSATCYVDWCLADNRSRSSGHIVTEVDPVSNALLARNVFRADFGQRIAFLDTSAADRTFTGDRAAFIGRNGSLAAPSALQFAHLTGRVGAALDACGAVQTRFAVPAGQTIEVRFVLGEGSDRHHARELAGKYRQTAETERAFESITSFWRQGLERISVKTPDPALDVLMNRWLPYQTLGCRYYARSAFYQSGGAFGFRDQLQDVLALLDFEPSIARDHLLRSASRQFPEGDVQHWWHEPGGEGVRTRIQDDRLWLVYAGLVYARHTGDWEVFDEQVPFIEQRAPGPDEQSVYEKPVRLQSSSSLYDHCLRAIARSLPLGPHGLPLMGTGDWNDGMDEVGAHGHGESVWLGWFLAMVLREFAGLAETRGDQEHAALYLAHAGRLIESVENAWDGDWYRRAYFDDGTPLGSRENRECKIDTLTQSWAVISGGGDRTRAAHAMQAVDRHLVDRENRLILLLTPPFDRAQPNPGYIRGYVPGVRENGGQYTHAALWVVLAHTLLGNGNEAYELLKFINPVHRSAQPTDVERYRVEPFVVAADIYSAPQHRGRGGWTWYTGAAGWMYRIALANILGIRREAGWLSIDPCIPQTWREFSATVKLPNAEYRIEVENPEGVSRGVRELTLDGSRCGDRRIRLDGADRIHVVRVVLGPESPAAAS
jgi:cyclic beta-1,2-glucan synthetase